jgi:acetyl esterase/lipase
MGQLAGSNPQFTEDELAAAESVRKLAQLAPTTILVGHGEPVIDGASAALEELARSLS